MVGLRLILYELVELIVVLVADLVVNKFDLAVVAIVFVWAEYVWVVVCVAQALVHCVAEHSRQHVPA